MDGTDVGAYRTNPFRGTHLAFFLRLLLQAQHEQEGARWPPPPLDALAHKSKDVLLLLSRLLQQAELEGVALPCNAMHAPFPCKEGVSFST